MGKPRTALLVIDVQVGPMWNTYQRDETVAVIQNMTERAKQRDIPVIYIQHEDPEGFLVRGSQFWQFAQGISPRPEDVIIYKQAQDSFYQTVLKEKLEQLRVTHLIVTGARTEYCIDTTCRAAISHGYDVTLAADGHTTADGAIPAETMINHHNQTLSQIGNPQRKIKVMPAAQIMFE